MLCLDLVISSAQACQTSHVHMGLGFRDPIRLVIYYSVSMYPFISQLPFRFPVVFPVILHS